MIPAHRVVLAAMSSKLGQLCDAGGMVVIRNIQFGILQKLVQLIYNGRVKLEGRLEVQDFRDGMDMLKVEGKVKEESETMDINSNIDVNEPCSVQEENAYHLVKVEFPEGEIEEQIIAGTQEFFEDASVISSQCLKTKNAEGQHKEEGCRLTKSIKIGSKAQLKSTKNVSLSMKRDPTYYVDHPSKKLKPNRLPIPKKQPIRVKKLFNCVHCHIGFSSLSDKLQHASKLSCYF